MAASSSWYHRPPLQAVGLFVFACLLYVNTLGHDYALDDAIVITSNSVVQRGAAGLPELFTHDTFYGFFDEQDRAALVSGGRYRPLTPAMFALERELTGGPMLHHLFNVFWYAVLVVVLYFLLRELRLPNWACVLTAALFAAHPLHTEAVANIKGRDEIVALLGALLALYAAVRAARTHSNWIAVSSALFLGVGLLAKENAITFVAVIPLFLYALRYPVLRYGWPVFLTVLGYLVLRYRVIGLDLGDPPTEWMNNPFLQPVAGGGRIPMTFFERLPTVLYTLLRYLKLLFVPTELVHDYYPAAITLRGWGSPAVILSLLFHLVLTGWAVLRVRGRFRLVALGVLTYLITLSIVSNLLFSVGTFMSERFAFMPSFGFVLAVGAGAVQVRERLSWAPWALVGVTALFAVLTVLRNPVWKDNYTLFTEDLPRQPRSVKLLNAAGGVRLDRYQSLDDSVRDQQRTLLTEAKRDLDRALEIYPTYRNAYLLRGNAHLLLNDYTAAIADYDRATKLGGLDASVRSNLVLALQRAGRQAGEQSQDFTTARYYLERADRLRPDDYETLRLLGVANGMSGQVDAALDYFERAVALQPANAGAVRNYATALHQVGRVEEARVQLARAEQLSD